jgi:hypothetical protein
MNLPNGEPMLSALAVSPVLTFQDAIDHVERTYPPAAGRVLKTALRQIARALIEVRARASGQYLDPNRKNRDLAGVPFDPVAINETLTGAPYRMAGFNSDKSFRNALSGLRRIGRDLGMIVPHRAPDLPPDNPYAPFLAAADSFELAAARRFAAKMIEDGLHPKDVTSDDLARYAAFLSTQMIGVKIVPMLRRIVDLWRRAADRHPD